MGATNGHHTPDSLAVTRAARPLALLRCRPSGLADDTAHLVHLVPLLGGSEASAAGVALCGALLRPDLAEAVAPGHGTPCPLCAISHTSPTPSIPAVTSPTAKATTSDRGAQAATVAYQGWGWPVTRHRNQVWLTLEPHAVALIIPTPLSAPVTTLLHQQRCPPLVLTHPDTPEHHILIAGQRTETPPPWPPTVHRLTGLFPLPPTPTPHGPVTWAYPPEATALWRCREIEVFAALRTLLRDPPPQEGT